MEKSFKYRIYPNAEQATLIQKTFGCVRFIYNHFLAKRQEVYDMNEQTLNYYQCALELTKLKQEKEWLYEVENAALQNALRNLDRAYQKFFQGLKVGNFIGYPKFKRKRDNHKSYTSRFAPSGTDGGNIAVIDTDRIKLPKLGLVKAVIDRPIRGRILNATISQNPSGQYHVAVCCTDVVPDSLPRTGNSIGIDLGIRKLVVTSNGMVILNPKHLKQSEHKLRKMQQLLSRKTKGSKNYIKTRIKLAKIHQKIRNQRNHHLHKVSIHLVREYDIICVESLIIPRMQAVEPGQKSKNINRSIHDVAWGELVRQLEYKAEWYDKKLVKVGKFYASSQTCYECGKVDKDITVPLVRKWQCKQCGVIHDRDINAAKNILREGLRLAK